MDFYRGWKDYVAGFGNVTGDHWMGLQYIHDMCPPAKPCVLRVEVMDGDENHSPLYAEYTNFSLTGFSDQYRLSVGSFSGTAADGLTHENHQRFSTYDRDNDAYLHNCAASMMGMVV